MNSSDMSDPSDKSDKSDKLIPKHGGYRRLRSFQAAQLAYDGTVIFCQRFVPPGSRTRDQMTQAARSGVQNIAEGSKASGTSKKTELRLTGVAYSSLEELLLDYEDYLRQHNLPQWDKESPPALRVRAMLANFPSDQSDLSDKSDRSDPLGLRQASAEEVANTLLCLINQAIYLLKRQLERLERDFLQQGGFTEKLYRLRREARERQSDLSDKSDNSDGQSNPACPKCGKPMRQRTARQGPTAGQTFWGCTGYPECKGTRPWKKAP